MTKRTGGKDQYSFLKQIGDQSYPPLIIQSADGVVTLDAKYIILENYSEKYKPKIVIEHIFGQINPRVRYSNTERTIDLRFTLAARNVHEAKANLEYCSKLARSPYGTWAVSDINQVSDRAVFDWAYHSQVSYIVNFGTLLRNQTVKVTSFDFEINFDAGVFDYGSTPVSDKMPDQVVDNYIGGQGYAEPSSKNIGQLLDDRWFSKGQQPGATLKEQEYVYHGEAGAVYPKAVSVNISMLALHSRPLCFGGSPRTEGSVGWSFTGEDGAVSNWPHGTGGDEFSPHSVAPYCQPDETGTSLPSDRTEQVLDEWDAKMGEVDTGDPPERSLEWIANSIELK